MSLTLQDIVQKHRHKIDPKLSYHQRKVMMNIAHCGTPEQGEIVLACNHCHTQKRIWASCRNRHCNRCGHRANALWLEKQLESLLPVPYAMVTFTIPSHLRVLFRYNPEICYDLLLKCSAEALRDAVKSTCGWGNDISLGIAAFLHTWTQCLDHHPHSHLVMPLGGLDHSDETWLSLDTKYLVTYKVLSPLFKGKLCDALSKAFKADKLKLPLDMKPFANAKAFKHWCWGSAKIHWRVDFSMPNGQSSGAFDYMARYVNRTAIANSRIVESGDQMVKVKYQDRKTNKTLHKEMSEESLLHKFVAHILPKGFTRVRWYGFLSCSKKRESIAIIRDALDDHSPATSQDRLKQITDAMLARLQLKKCQFCKQGEMVFVRLRSALERMAEWRLGRQLGGLGKDGQTEHGQAEHGPSMTALPGGG